MSTWHIITSEYPPDVGGVSDYTRQVSEGLAGMGDAVHVWCPNSASHAIVPGLHIHSELSRIRPRDLKRLDGLLDAFPRPRRLLVQWVPHGFGYHSMNIWFCLWLARRARAGDFIELMVHEPYLEFSRGPIRHVVMACVHRLMTVILLRAATRVWMSIPAWEAHLRPYALGRALSMQWLPVPGCVEASSAGAAVAVRLKYVTSDRLLLGHFGSYGSSLAGLLEERLPALMDGPFAPALLLLGVGSDRYRTALLARHPSWSDRVHAVGYLPPADLAAHIAACDLFVQPYPDGITSRRTSVMACLSQARPVVATKGPLTESLWEESGAVLLADVADPTGFAAAASELLCREDTRRALGLRGRQLYTDRFSVRRVVDTLRAA